MTNSTVSNFKRTWAKDFGPISFFGILLWLYLFLANKLVYSYDFADETEKLIVARLVDSGLRLYKDIFVQHGPLAYILSDVLYKITESHSLAPYRYIPVFLSLAALLSVMTCPLLSTNKMKFFSGSLFLFGLSIFQAHYGLVMAMYQVYSGYLLIISFSVFILPMSLGIKVQPWRSFIAGFCMSWLFFCSFAYAIVIAFSLFIFCFKLSYSKQERKKLFVTSLLGAVVGTILVSIWRILYSDFYGYYLLHFYFNLVYYKNYLVGIGSLPVWWAPIRLLNPFFLKKFTVTWPSFILHLIQLFIILLWLSCLHKLKVFGPQKKRYFLYSILFFAVFLYSNPRANIEFAESTYVIVSLGIVSLFMGFIIEKRRDLSPIYTRIGLVLVSFFVIFCLVSQSTDKTVFYESNVSDYYEHRGDLGPSGTEEMTFLRKVVGENDKVLQVPFSLHFYVWSDRLPSSGVFYWMPWMNDYAKSPVKDYSFNLCSQTSANPPKAIYYTDTAIWERPPESFLGCFQDLLKRRYFRSFKVQNVWFRDDVAFADKEVLSTSIIPEDYDVAPLNLELREKVKKSKIKYGLLRSNLNQKCVWSEVENKTLKMGGCESEKALKIGINSDGKIVSSPSFMCIDYHENEEHIGGIRVYPCINTNAQTFSVKKGVNGIYIESAAAKRCLSVSGDLVVGEECAKATQWSFL